MSLKRLLPICALMVTLGVSLVAFGRQGGSGTDQRIQHVLLISVDGLHALDVAHYVSTHKDSALAELSQHGVTFTNAHTPANSDSFPGLLALATGGSPVTTGLFYDVSYDRTIFDPSNKNCTGEPGNNMIFDESVDLYKGNVSQDVLDPNSLPRHFDQSGHCVPLFPHQALRTNTIFEVVKAAGGRTAWADKHPAYDIVNGPSGKGVDDLYTPEITNVNGFDATASVVCTVLNDQKKVNAILNEIGGFTHDGKFKVGVPTVFGMNFQAVSVGQKLSNDNSDNSCAKDPFTGQQGGYLPDAVSPTPVLEYGLEQTDAALGAMISALKHEGIYDSTLFIVSAKHGQSPINPARVNKPGHFADLVTGDSGTDAGAAAIAAAGNCSIGSCGFVQDDDIALIWLQDQSQTQAAANYLNKNAKKLFIDEVMAGEDLTLKFNDPTKDSRTPDIIVQPQYGTIYTTSSKKNAEHGGFSFGDTNVGLIVSNPEFSGAVLKTPVSTAQVAPTILQSLGLDPQALKSVRVEKTETLPGLTGGASNVSEEE
ncbi:MAG TPA: alkaline phosphatase family protein [Terriglobales bacterium]|nr:alkaline phosphatase family protein [Terriglobales bacterium]